MIKTIVITVEGNVLYQLRIDKTIDQVLEEIDEAGTYYMAAPTCAIKRDKILSVEYFESEDESND